MIKVGLTGSRFSGNDTICNMFKEIGIPVFYSDVVLKYIINQDFTMLDRIKRRVGIHVFNPPYIDGRLVKSRDDFDAIIDCVESELMKAYEKFNKKHIADSFYTIFHSSILFEREWNRTNMDFNINIFCPKKLRVVRSNILVAETFDLLRNEMDDLKKNELANYIIHNYGVCDARKQVNEIDHDLIEAFIKNKEPKGNKIEVLS